MEIVQSQINYDWARKKLGEIASVKYGFTGKAATEGKYRYVRITDINKTGLLTSNEKKYIKDLIEVEDYLLKDNDLLMARTGATFANVLLYKDYEPSIFASYLIRISFDIEMENKLYWYFSKSKNYWDQANKLSSGAAQPHFNGKALKNIIFTYPKSTLEQKLIVAILDQAFAAIDQAQANIQQNIQNAQDLFQSKLNQIFSQRGEGWEEKTFEELSTRIGDGLHGTPKYDENGKYYFINGNNLNNGKIEIKDNTKRINESEFIKHRRDLTDNTVLVSINGTLGNVAFYDNEPVILGKSACYINFKDTVYKSYIKYLIKSPLFFANMSKESTGATIKNFSLKSMRGYRLLLPPKNVQVDFVKQLEQIEKQINAIVYSYEVKANNLEELKKSLLQKAFSGELTQNKQAA